MQNKLVSVIVVNYNGRGIIGACLESITKQSYKECEIIIVDNSSCDGSLNEIKGFIEENSSGRQMKVISNKSNIGFAGGNIEGLKHSRGEYVALLNPDAIADPKWLEELVRALDLHSEVGICASKIISHGSNVIDSAGDGYAYSLKGFKRGEGENAERFDRSGYVFGACAGAALYRKRMIDEIGFLDKDFFLIHEDTDLNYRAQLAGWKVLYVPSAIVYHKVRSIIGNMSDIAVYYTLRNSEFVRIKNVPMGVLQKCLPALIIGTVTEFIYFGLKHKKFILFFRAKIDALRGLPGMLKKRAEIMKNRRANTKYLLSVMTSVWQKDFLKFKINKFFYA
jgi:GT2 family glycosyltransferase